MVIDNKRQKLFFENKFIYEGLNKDINYNNKKKNELDSSKEKINTK